MIRAGKRLKYGFVYIPVKMADVWAGKTWIWAGPSKPAYFLIPRLTLRLEIGGNRLSGLPEAWFGLILGWVRRGGLKRTSIGLESWGSLGGKLGYVWAVASLLGARYFQKVVVVVDGGGETTTTTTTDDYYYCYNRGLK